MSNLRAAVRRSGQWVPVLTPGTTVPVDPPPAATTRTYAAPSGSPVSAVFTVSANGTETACYQTALDFQSTRHHFANFETDEAGPVTVTVTSTVAITTAFIRPVRHGITPTFTPGGTTLTFPAANADTYVVVINGDWLKPLYIFANPYVATPPSPASFTYYYGPGLYNNTLPDGTTPLGSYWGELRLNAAESVYVDGGAYVYGKIFMGPGTAGVGATTANVHASGYGVVDASTSTATMGPGRVAQIGNISTGSFDGITLVSQQHWGIPIVESNNVSLSYMKMFNRKMAGGQTPDGCDIVGSRNVTIANSFIYGADDIIAIKTAKSGFPGAFPTGSWRGNVDNISVLDCVLQGGPDGNGVEIGYELFNNSTDGTTALIDPTTGVKIAYVRNISYQRVDMVRKTFDPTVDYRCAPIGIHATDDTPVSNILYEDFNVDDTVSTDAWIWIGSGAWDSYTYGQRGPITGVTFRRVNFRAGNPNPLEIRFNGGSATQRISGVTIEDLFIKGQEVTAAASSAGNWVWNATNTDAPTFLTGSSGGANWPTVTTTLANLNPAVTENTGLSGMVMSALHTDIAYVVNDHGTNVVRMVNVRTGLIVGIITLTGATVIDWEDITRGPGNTIVVGDIGDNALTRTDYKLYSFPEPSAPSTYSVAPTVYPFTYSDGLKHNAETLLWDPVSNQFHTFVKISTTDTIGKWVDAPVGTLSTGTNVFTLTSRSHATAGFNSNAFGGDYTPTGDRYVLQRVQRVSVYDRAGVLAGEYLYDPVTLPQAESVCWVPQATGVLVSSEQSSTPPIVYIPIS